MRTKLLAVLILLPQLTGCLHIVAVRVGDDNPRDLHSLLKHHEYERAEQLLDQHSYLDTPEHRKKLHEQIARYEQNNLAVAQAREQENDLLGAIEVLDAALLKLPYSTNLNEYRRTTERKRAEYLKANERKQLLSRAGYVVTQQQLYQEQLDLESPSVTRRVLNTRHQQEASTLATELLTCGQDALQQDDLDTADKCLHLSQTINDTPEVREVLARLLDKRDAIHQSRKEKAKVKRIRKEKKRAKTRKNKTQVLLVQTEQALDENDLLAARSSFHKIPARGVNSPQVAAIRERLDDAIKPRVSELVGHGDRQYRADRINPAIDSWNKALELDPDNMEIRERLERANKVLARLEELKSRQK